MNPHTIRKAAEQAARSELRASRDWWNDDRNFGSILPPALAERLRAPLYALGIGIGIAGAGSVMHVEVNPGGTAIGIVLLVAVAALVEWLDPRHAPQPAPRLRRLGTRRLMRESDLPPAPVRFPPAWPAEAQRLTRPATGDTIPLDGGHYE